ncbi:hypothetical protein [Streptomyces sp. NPDC051776]|uniref:hypothetical protein n=1 Tax=Streptomyces sp. NPDC051776 TaxID=3155414 RepID=UPI0034369306
MFYRPSSKSWHVAAESAHRSPVQYALGEMSRTTRARGEKAATELWGPENGSWKRFAASAPEPPKTAPEPEPDKPRGHARHVERMADRRQQALMAGLSKAGIYDLAPEDTAAIQALVDTLDEASVRRVAHWLAAAGNT